MLPDIHRSDFSQYILWDILFILVFNEQQLLGIYFCKLNHSPVSVVELALMVP